MGSLTLGNNFEISPTIIKTLKLKTEFFPYSFVFCYKSEPETKVCSELSSKFADM
jgi:hypothetical protein